MDQADVEELFCRFASPLADYVSLGGRKEAVAMLAKTLWAALIAGPASEKETWNSLKATDNVDPSLLESVQACYYDKMKPVVSEEQLTELRERYGVQPRE